MDAEVDCRLSGDAGARSTPSRRSPRPRPASTSSARSAMALDVASGERMLAAARAHGVRLGVAYYRHHYPVIARLRVLVRRARSASRCWPRSRPSSPSDAGVRDDPRAWLLPPERVRRRAHGRRLAADRIEVLLATCWGPSPTSMAFPTTSASARASVEDHVRRPTSDLTAGLVAVLGDARRPRAAGHAGDLRDAGLGAREDPQRGSTARRHRRRDLASDDTSASTRTSTSRSSRTSWPRSARAGSRRSLRQVWSRGRPRGDPDLQSRPPMTTARPPADDGGVPPRLRVEVARAGQPGPEALARRGRARVDARRHGRDALLHGARGPPGPPGDQQGPGRLPQLPDPRRLRGRRDGVRDGRRPAGPHARPHGVDPGVLGGELRLRALADARPSSPPAGSCSGWAWAASGRPARP